MKKAKRLLAILLVLCMAFALFACGDKSGGSSGTSTPPSGTGSGDTGSGDTGSGDTGSGDTGSGDTGSTAGGPAETGFFDHNYDYTQHKKFRVAYLTAATGVMYDGFAQQFEVWCDRLNLSWNGHWAPAENNAEQFLSGLESHADMGLDGLLLDPDTNLASRIAEVLSESGILWVFCMSQARETSTPYSIMGEFITGRLLAPNVGFNNVAVGKTMTTGLVEWKEEAYPDVPWSKVGFIAIDMSTSLQLHERALGAEMAFAELVPELGAYDPDPTVNPNNFYIADTSSGAPTQETATNLCTQLMSSPPNPEIEVWLIQPAFWDFAAGAQVAAENMGMVDKVCITNFGSGNAAVALWETGDPTPIRFSLETASSVFAEAIINGLWAMMAGFATPDTLWPEWQLVWDKGDEFALTSEDDPVYKVPKVEVADGKPVVAVEHGYASMILPMIWVTPETYVEFYGWVDLYAYGPDATEEERIGAGGTMYDLYKFPLGTDINAFQARGEVPEYYNQYPNG